jgi:hypothetical protein
VKKRLAPTADTVPCARVNLGGFRLVRWLEQNKKMAQWLAQQMNVNVSTLSRWANGKQTISQVARLAIEYLTDKAVMADDWDKEHIQ